MSAAVCVCVCVCRSCLFLPVFARFLRVLAFYMGFAMMLLSLPLCCVCVCRVCPFLPVFAGFCPLFAFPCILSGVCTDVDGVAAVCGVGGGCGVLCCAYFAHLLHSLSACAWRLSPVSARFGCRVFACFPLSSCGGCGPVRSILRIQLCPAHVVLCFGVGLLELAGSLPRDELCSGGQDHIMFLVVIAFGRSLVRQRFRFCFGAFWRLRVCRFLLLVFSVELMWWLRPCPVRCARSCYVRSMLFLLPGWVACARWQLTSR